MRVIWICDLIFRDFCSAYGVKDINLGGWMSGMLNVISVDDTYEIGCCFPIRNEAKMLNGKIGKWNYYSFHALEPDDCSEAIIDEFEEIYNSFKPDVIHIWGTEYGHSLAALKAAKKCSIINRVLIHIQGLVSVIPDYFMVGIPEGIGRRTINGMSIWDECSRFKRQGINEKEILRNAPVVLGRTTWDKAYIENMFRCVFYFRCDEILRKEFYDITSRWDVYKCKRKQIFVSQAFYALKGLHLIIPAIAQLKEMYSDLSVLIGGINPFANEDKAKWSSYGMYLYELINKYDLGDVIIFLGNQNAEKMIENYMNANVYVNCSTIENSSNSIGEAQMIGTPVIASYTGGTPDLVENMKTGLLYQLDADYMFVSCVRRIFDDDEFAKKISINEQRTAEERYSPDRVKKQLTSIYKKVAGGIISEYRQSFI